jgi:hypothetical protein
MGWVKNKGTYKYVNKPYGFNTATGESTPDIEDLVKAISFAETGHLKNDPYIRTQVTGSGSSAFGPLQITKSALTGPGYDDIGFSPMIDEWIQDFYLPQRQLSLDYGGIDMVPGMERHDYGGKGDFKEEDKALYDIMGKSLIEHIYESVGYNLDEFINTWRFGTDKSKWGSDPKYSKKVKSKLK